MRTKNRIRIDQVLVNPLVTEKSVAMTGKVMFKVHDKADKSSIVNAFASMYGVTPTNVRVLNMPEKTRNRGGKIMLRQRPYRKAIITLPEGKTVDTNVFVTKKA